MVLRTLLLAASLSPLAAAQSMPLKAPLVNGLTGAEVCSPVVTLDSGAVRGTYELGNRHLVLTANLALTGVTNPVVHLHFGSAHPMCTEGSIIQTFAGGPFSFTLTRTLLDGEHDALGGSGLNVDVHDGPTGPPVIRGQLRLPLHLTPPPPTGSAVVPPNASAGTGSATFVVDPVARTVAYQLTVAGLTGTPTTAAVHDGLPGANGPQVFPLTSTGAGTWAGTSGVLTVDEVLRLSASAFYVQVSSTAFPSGEVRAQILPTPLDAAPGAISIGAGGDQLFYLFAGAANAADLYLLLGTASGTAPGLPVGPVVLPLNLDAFFLFSLESANSPPYHDSLGLLDGCGSGFARLAIPTGLSPALAALDFHHAYLVNDAAAGFTFASNPVGLDLVP